MIDLKHEPDKYIWLMLVELVMVATCRLHILCACGTAPAALLESVKAEVTRSYRVVEDIPSLHGSQQLGTLQTGSRIETSCDSVLNAVLLLRFPGRGVGNGYACREKSMWHGG